MPKKKKRSRFLETARRVVRCLHQRCLWNGASRHASTAGITEYVRPAAAGFLMQKELECLGHALGQAARPYVSIVGGSKVSDKIELIENFLGLASQILIGGAMAYTFLRAKGIETGKSLVEVDKIDLARDLMSCASRSFTRASRGSRRCGITQKHGVQHCSRHGDPGGSDGTRHRAGDGTEVFRNHRCREDGRVERSHGCL
jgi:hypothetical protein